MSQQAPETSPDAEAISMKQQIPETSPDAEAISIKQQIPETRGALKRFMSSVMFRQFIELADWNSKNLKCEPEQARKNIEAMVAAGEFILSIYNP